MLLARRGRLLAGSNFRGSACGFMSTGADLQVEATHPRDPTGSCSGSTPAVAGRPCRAAAGYGLLSCGRPEISLLVARQQEHPVTELLTTESRQIPTVIAHEIQ